MNSQETSISEEQLLFLEEKATDSLRQSLIDAGYSMARSQALSIEENIEDWQSNIINGRINPKCIDITDQAWHAYYCFEIDTWMVIDEQQFPNCKGSKEVYDLLDKYDFTDDYVLECLYEGNTRYLNDKYGMNWSSEYPEPNLS